MPHGNNNKLKRLALGLLAFFGPIAIGAAVIKVGGYAAFWLLNYFLMLFIPVGIVLYLVYRYIVHISAEKVEDRFKDQGEGFLSSLEEQFDFVQGVVWDRSFKRRSRLSARKPFDKLAVSTSEEWEKLSIEQKQQLADQISRRLFKWIMDNEVKKKGHDIKIDFYSGDEHLSLVGKYSAGQLDLLE